jgi:hypothetical protein
MTKRSAGWVVAFVVVLACTLGAVQAGGDGRYQIVIGEWTVLGDGGQMSDQGTVVRIDTTTGRTHLLAFARGKYLWVPVPDGP